MRCSHTFIKRAVYGQRDTCRQCGVEYIYDGKKWIWIYDLGMSKVKKMEQAYRVDSLTGKHR